MPCRIFTYLTEILQSQIIVLTNWRAFLDCVYCFFLQQNKPCSISALTFFTCRNRCNWKLSDMALATGALTMHWVAIAFRVWIVERCTENDVCAVGAVDIAWAVWQAICHRTRRVLGLVIGHKISIKLRGRERESCLRGWGYVLPGWWEISGYSAKDWKVRRVPMQSILKKQINKKK